MTKKTNETIDNAMELTHKTANVALKGAVQTAEVTEGFVQGMYHAGYEANVDALKVAKNYWDTTSQLRQDWIKLFASAGDAFISAAANSQLPMQKEIAEFGKNVVDTAEKSFDTLNNKAKAAAK